ncbi:MAG: hypothetical protein LQ338_001283 [Usnochroma carphineum]|nr:MAG: hypothetical protein LQ338_001283 [Usnochroma carphineum]
MTTRIVLTPTPPLVVVVAPLAVTAAPGSTCTLVTAPFKLAMICSTIAKSLAELESVVLLVLDVALDEVPGLGVTALPEEGQNPSTMHPACGILFAAAQSCSRETDGREEYRLGGAWPVEMWVPQQTAQRETVAGVRQAEQSGERAGRLVRLGDGDG